MLLYKHHDQESLNRQFNNRLHVADFANYFKRWEKLSRETESSAPCILNISYGILPREKLDIYPSACSQSKTLIFIHGGYWHMLDKNLFSFIVNSYKSYGITTILINYPLSPHSSLDQIVLSCRQAMNWIYNNISSFHGDPQKLYVAGHSAGGHLAAMLVATDWQSINSQLPVNLVKGACLMSGIFNLLPVHLSYLNSVLQWDDNTCFRNSPVNTKPLNKCRVIIAVGENETSEFKGQAHQLTDAWIDKGSNLQQLTLKDTNHFSIVDSFVDASSTLHTSVLELLKV